MAKVSTITTGPKTPIKLPKVTREPRQHFEWQMPKAPIIPAGTLAKDSPELEGVLGGAYNPKTAGQTGVKKTGGDK